MPQGENWLTDQFDCVVMLTWSNWKTEPRSNRYHYATRFAKHLPVYFIQVSEPSPGGSIAEPADAPGITIVHLGSDYGPDQSNRFLDVMEQAGHRKPLYWIYNPRFMNICELCPSALKVYHATEDYFGQHSAATFLDELLYRDYLAMVPKIDLVVAVSDPVAHNTREKGGYQGPMLTLKNGCDAEHWIAAMEGARSSDARIAIYQGGINSRLDFDLIMSVIDSLPGWRFWFCGDSSHANSPVWNEIAARPNVRAFGKLRPAQIARLQARATVGLIPFQQSSFIEVSLPLKAYEYVASGLPVVTVPIRELEQRPEFFDTATDAAGFVEKIQASAATRWDEDCLAARLQAARAESYDQRFEDFLKLASEFVSRTPGHQTTWQRPKSVLNARPKKVRKDGDGKRVLVAYSASGIHVQTTADYLNSLARYIDGEVDFVHITNGAILDFDLDDYDVVFQNYCARWPYIGHISEDYAEKVAHFKGPKILAVQDEYDRTGNLLDAMDRVGYDVVLTCIPPDQVERVYPKARFPNTEFIQVLTGYVPEDLDYISQYAIPLRERTNLIGYRGRDIGPKYGRLGFDKLEIGRRMRAACEERGLSVDIDWTEDSRIYGHEWFRFIGSCRATMGTESGSNVFDFDESVERLYQQLTEQHGRPPTYEEFLPLIAEQDASMDMGQISPKFFEAAALRTPMVLLRGRYADMIEAETHYIPLEQDYSNIDEVLERLNDFDALEAMTERTYEHLVGSGKFSYQRFVNGVDALLNRKIEELKVKPRAANRAFHRLESPAAPEADGALYHENPTKAPMTASDFQLRITKQTMAHYKRHIQHLETVYPEQIAYLNKALADENQRLTALLNSEVERVTRTYQGQIAELQAELANKRGVKFKRDAASA